MSAVSRKSAKNKSMPQKYDTPIAVRLNYELLAAVDAEAERLRIERPGAKISRGEVIRETLGRYLLSREPRRNGKSTW
jgi:hypothetical protein